jgi:hypothetical protein
VNGHWNLLETILLLFFFFLNFFCTCTYV